MRLVTSRFVKEQCMKHFKINSQAYFEVLIHLQTELMVAPCFIAHQNGGATRDRTADLLRARQALSQLSYSPFLLVFFTLCCVAFVACSVTYLCMFLHALRQAPCLA